MARNFKDYQWQDTCKKTCGSSNSCRAKVIAGKSNTYIFYQLQHCIVIKEPKVYCDSQCKLEEDGISHRN